MKKVSASVEVDVLVPDETTEDDIALMSFEIPIEQIRVDGGEGPIVGARVTGYTTGLCEEA